jgi:hypothetical protein
MHTCPAGHALSFMHPASGGGPLSAGPVSVVGVSFGAGVSVGVWVSVGAVVSVGAGVSIATGRSWGTSVPPPSAGVTVTGSSPHPTAIRAMSGSAARSLCEVRSIGVLVAPSGGVRRTRTHHLT